MTHKAPSLFKFFFFSHFHSTLQPSRVLFLSLSLVLPFSVSTLCFSCWSRVSLLWLAWISFFFSLLETAQSEVALWIFFRVRSSSLLTLINSNILKFRKSKIVKFEKSFYPVDYQQVRVVLTSL